MTTTAAGSAPKHMQALAQANATRIFRAGIRAALSGDDRVWCWRRCGELILDPPERIGTLTVFALLTMNFRTRRQTALRILRKARISERRRISSLTRRERVVLAEILGVREPRPPSARRVPVVVAVTDALAGMPTDGVAEWWRFRRRELGGLSPREAVLSDAGSVVRLAEMDAANLRCDEERSDG